MKIDEIPVGLQTWSLAELSGDVNDMLKDVRCTGIDAIEVSIPYPCGRTEYLRDALKNVKSACKTHGLKVLGYHAPALFVNYDSKGRPIVTDDYFKGQVNEIKCACTRLMMSEEAVNVTIMDQKWVQASNFATVIEYATLLNQAAQELKKFNDHIHVYFHPYPFHFEQFSEKDSQTGEKKIRDRNLACVHEPRFSRYSTGYLLACKIW